MLRTACSRLGINLIHARPYDPEARGKMERFWRTLREGCSDHLGEVGSLADINQRLALFLERHYHGAPHAGLMGRAPLTAYAPSERVPNRVDEAALREALAVRERRRVRRDTTVSVLGRVYELEQGFLAGRVVDVVYSHLDDPPRPEVEYEAKRWSTSYVAYRLKLAGADKNIFAQDAVALMHEHATGALRDVDRVAHGAMRDAARRKRKIVDRDAVERVLAGRLPIA